MKCVKCGTEVSPNDHYCKHCGVDLSGIRVLETVNYKNETIDRMAKIFSQENKTQEEMRIEACDYIIAEIIGDKSGKELEPFLTNVSIDTNIGGLVIALTFLPDQFRRQ